MEAVDKEVGGASDINSVAERCSGFYEFYQIAKEYDSDDSEECEPQSSRESTGKTVGLNSPWGRIWNIASETGWNYHYILWGVSWINIQMMLADAPRYIRKSKDKDEIKMIKDEIELAEFFGVPMEDVMRTLNKDKDAE